MDLFYRNRGRFRPVLVVLTVVLLGGILYCIDFRSLRKTSSETLESATETTKVPTNDPSKSIATSRLETGSSLAPPESNNTLCLDPDYSDNSGSATGAEIGKQHCKCHDPSTPLSFPNTDRRGQQWHNYHQRMVSNALSVSSPLDLVMVGDSLVELWNGTGMFGNIPYPTSRQVFDRYFTKAGKGSLEGLALGCSGDQLSHLLWHLENGMLPTNLQPKVWLLLTGTNDLGYAKCSKQTTLSGILYLAKFIHERRPRASILIHGLLPRSEKGSRHFEVGRFWNDIQWINKHLRAFVDESRSAENITHQSPFYYVDSGEIFLNKNRTHLSSRLMKDGIHPRPPGMKVWAPVIVEAVKYVLRDQY